MPQSNKTNILAIIVLYNTKLEDSDTYNTLKASIAVSSLNGSMEVVVYDNSAVPETVKSNLPPDILYFHDVNNGGVSHAYNYALDLALQCGCEWLLLLDQDSELPPDFIDNCLSDIISLYDKSSIVAIVPTVYCGSKLISPCKIGWGGKMFPISGNGVGVRKDEITAINSGALVKVAFLNSIGGFSNEYWLDMLDHWLFRTIYGNKLNVAISDNKISHDLSIQNYSTMSLTRYQNIVTAESRFCLTNRSIAYKLVFRFRLAVRVLKLLLIHGRADLSMVTLNYVFRGLTTDKPQRASNFL